MVLKMLFFTFSKGDIRFTKRELVWRTYIAAETLSTTRKVEIIDKKKFAVAALNADNEILVVHVASLVEPTTILIHSSGQAKVVLLISEETELFAEYSNFPNVFFSDSAAELLEHTRIIDHFINLLDDK